MPNNAPRLVTVLATLLLSGCLIASGLVWAQQAAQTEAPTSGDAESETPAADESVETADPAPASAETDPGTVLDYEPTESISEDLSVSFPVDI